MFCKECGKKLQGRSDKRFCSSDCRGTYHNRRKREEIIYLRKLETSLRKNLHLLQKLRKEGVSQLPQSEFERMGFDFSFYTHSVRGARSERIFFCYDIPYLLEKEKIVVLSPAAVTARLLPVEAFMR